MTGFRTLIIAAASAAALGGASIAAAQPAPPPPPALDQAPVDPEQLALAKHLMSLLSNQMNLGAVMKSVNAQMMQAVRQQNPKMDPAVIDRVTAALDKSEAEVLPEMMDDMAHSYARHLSRKEMEDTVAFYEGPSGQAILHKLPEIMQDLGPLMVKYIPRMQHTVFEALCADNACTPEQRQALEHQAGAGPPPAH